MEATRSGTRRTHVAVIVAVLIGIVVVAGLVWLVMWALKGGTGMKSAGFSDNRTAWESAMAKASVEATYPGGPVDLNAVRATGAHPFEATFTAEELDALLAVYRYEARQQGTSVALERVFVLLPEAGHASIRGRIRIGDTAYAARANGPVEWRDGVVIDEEVASVNVEGFTLTGSRKRDALNAIEAYLNELLATAPGLRVEDASITAEGLAVRGTAPVRLEHPEPLKP